MKENRIPKRVWNEQDQEVDQQTDGKMKRGMMEEDERSC
jgi:hypothetical protein